MNTKEVIVFADAVNECLKLAKGSDGICIVSRDCDYFMVSKAIKDAIEQTSIMVECFNLDDGMQNIPKNYKSLFDFDSAIELVIAVGNDELINIVRYFSSKKGIKCIAVPTEIAFLEIFNPYPVFFDEGIPTRVGCQELMKIVIDLRLLANLKKQAFADAFAQIVSKLTAVVDYVAECVLNNRAIDDYAVAKAYSIIEELGTIDCEGAKSYIKIIKAQLRMGILYSKFANLDGAETSLARILSTMGEQSYFESLFYSSVRLVKVYGLYLRLKLYQNIVTADYNGRLEMLSKIISADELEMLLNYEPLEQQQIIEKNLKLQSSSELLNLVVKAEKLNEKLLLAYGYVYNGKQKRANFTFEEVKLALKLSPYISGELLSLINDSGVLESVE